MAAPQTAGLDLGATTVRAVEVKRTKNRPMIERFEQVAMPPGAVVGGVVKDAKAVTAALKQLRSGKALSSGSVALAVSHSQVVVREIEIANLPEAEMRQALPHQVRDVLPLPVDDAILDFFPLEDAGGGEARKGRRGKDKDADTGRKDTVRGLLTAAPREAVADTVEAVERAGLHVERVDLACFAVLRAVAASTSGAEAVVDIGATTTLFVIHIGGVPQIVRTIPRGGDEITALLSRRLNISVPDAEQYKCQVGLTRMLGADAADAMDEAVRPLVNEIRSSIGYFAKSQPDAVVSKMTLVGGGSRLRGLTETLGGMIGVPAALGNPLQYVGYARRGSGHDELSDYRSAAAVSVGLTLGAAS